MPCGRGVYWDRDPDRLVEFDPIRELPLVCDFVAETGTKQGVASRGREEGLSLPSTNVSTVCQLLSVPGRKNSEKTNFLPSWS